MTSADMLAEMGFSVVEAASAEQALLLLENGLSADLLMTDHLMSGMTGVELAYTVSKRWPEIRAIVISGFAEAEGLAPDVLRLTKPFRQMDLKDALRQLGFGASRALEAG
jgi:CheY-like chemotaxis protein